jgi:hypothetical protein
MGLCTNKHPAERGVASTDTRPKRHGTKIAVKLQSKNQISSVNDQSYGGPGGIRTHDTRLKRPLL